MTNILVVYTRTPMTLATQARALQDCSGGRLAFGQGSQIKPHVERRYSMPWSSPAARMAEFVSALLGERRATWLPRRALHGHVDGTDVHSSFGDPDTPALRGRRGSEDVRDRRLRRDGLLVHGFRTEGYLREVTVHAIARGAGGAVPDGFEIVDLSFLLTGRSDEEWATSTKAVREQLALFASTPLLWSSTPRTA